MGLFLLLSLVDTATCYFITILFHYYALEMSSGCKNRKVCGCREHHFFASFYKEKYYLCKVISNLKRKSCKKLIELQLLDRRRTYVCNLCLKYCYQKFMHHDHLYNKICHDSDGELFETSDDDDDDVVDISDVSNTQLVEDSSADDSSDVFSCNFNPIEGHIIALESYVKGKRNCFSLLSSREKSKLSNIAQLLGEVASLDIYKDSIKSTKEYKDTDFAKNVRPVEWFESQNLIVTSFLKGCAGTTAKSSPKKINALVHAVEQIQFARNLLAVTPFAFNRNLVNFSMSHSKSSVELNGAWEPAGSYNVVHQFLHAETPPPDCPDGDVQVSFDNNQKIGHSSGRIREGASVPMSICTSVSTLKENLGTDLQLKNFNQSAWPKISSAESVRRVNLKEKIQRESFKGKVSVYTERLLKRGSIEPDYVNQAVKLKHLGGSVTVCQKCCSVTKGSEVCSCCGHDPVHAEADFDPYGNTQSNIPSEKPHVTIMDPCMVNPNSKKSVSTVLKQICHMCKLDSERKWVVVWSDRVPYLYGSQLQDLLVCSVCKQDVSKTSLSFHCCRNASFRPQFDGLILRPGPGHIEMNMAKCLLAVLWVPILSKVSAQLGFRSPKAQDVVRNGVDHH